MLMNDSRRCAQAVNEMLADANELASFCWAHEENEKALGLREIPVLEREVGYHHKVWLFGHYDSRGGASMLIGGTAGQALAKYADSFAYEEGEDMTDVALEDLNQIVGRPLPLIILDRELEMESQELMKSFGGHYKTAWLDISTYWWQRYNDPPVWSKVCGAKRQALILYTKGLPKNYMVAETMPETFTVNGETRRNQLAGEPRCQIHYRFTTCDLGEDACGLCLEMY